MFHFEPGFFADVMGRTASGNGPPISKVEMEIEMAGRPKGTPKTGGRPKGTPNKRTTEAAEAAKNANSTAI